jgi:hypothetical protein
VIRAVELDVPAEEGEAWSHRDSCEEESPMERLAWVGPREEVLVALERMDDANGAPRSASE